ncbi:MULTISPECIES: DUF371 domain-containing protein [unclassified Halorubrum]|uniref:DUF371 domain-containing protein n=1 Tax=unclassified Halorubrum TaxID=2642239 RepID=UPI000B997EA9|nr:MULTISPECIES: DUF371 domain-containing protein [unclassified Halorubrum]OYR44707.1 hypothetical protein DJ81_06775 [Halorubrum sp. Hd13]OYR45247.1 hypothetical protein DJ75_08415 [Halorubrum sp. Eb13]OYR46561.1 hypothetical protein DJ74_14855 [Halorubrum sp. Ea8]OYR55152.1 hypothetical protein DJ73_03440 [Halorubrum sp. Ea1]
MSDAESEIDDGDDADDDPLVEVVRAAGHEHVTAEHASTFEFTTDDWLTPAGDCIVGVAADRAPRDFSASFREACRDADATVSATIAVGEPGDEAVDLAAPAHVDRIAGRGDPDLTLLDDRSMVGRTSDYTDDERTILVDGDGAAADLDRDLVAALAEGAPVALRLAVEPAE